MFRGEPGFQKEVEGYDIRDDQAMSGLQTATNKKGTHRYRAVPLRSARVAGIDLPTPAAKRTDLA
jgi:hypothetical protein